LQILPIEGNVLCKGKCHVVLQPDGMLRSRTWRQTQDLQECHLLQRDTSGIDSGWTWVLNESTNHEVCLNENCDPTKRLTKFLFINVALPRHRGQEEITGLMKETRGNSPRKEVNSSIDRDLLGPVLHPLPPQCQSVAVDLGTILFMFNSSDRLSFSYHVLAYLIDRDRPLGQFL
jgi:hypothetical protein